MLEALLALVSVLILLVVYMIFNQQKMKKPLSEDRVIESILNVADSKFRGSMEQGAQQLEQKKELIATELKTVSSQVKEIDDILKALKSDYKSITANSLKENSESFTTITSQKLQAFAESGKEMISKEGKLINEGQKSLADKQMTILEEKRTAISDRLAQMEKVMKQFTDRIDEYEKFNSDKFLELNEQIRQTSELTQTLGVATNNLVNMLKNTKQRGQFGEQIAEDILRFAGLIEDVNFVKQSGGEDGRPDFKFLLPDNRHLVMDVKFPLNSYQSMFESEHETDKQSFEKQFMTDVKNHVKALSKKDYISDKSLDYIIMFIPNEGIFSFINELDPQLALGALRERIIICSPLTLFAVLGIIKQSINNFRLHQAASEIQSLMNAFYDQWKKYSEEVEKVSKQLATVAGTFEKLTGTRANQLEKQLDKIQNLNLGDTKNSNQASLDL
jgi:DNA recombination protein RmuC